MTANTAPTITESQFGAMPDGTPISQFTVTNSNGIEAKIINYGGIITSLKTPDRNGTMGAIVLLVCRFSVSPPPWIMNPSMTRWNSVPS